MIKNLNKHYSHQRITLIGTQSNDNMQNWLYFNANPKKLHTGDCVYRALSRFLGITWRETVDELVSFAADQGRVNFNYRSTYTPFLAEKGYERHKAPRKGMTVGEFCESFAKPGMAYLIQVPRHLTVVEWIPGYNISMNVDTFNCENKVIEAYWDKPVEPGTQI